MGRNNDYISEINASVCPPSSRNDFEKEVDLRHTFQRLKTMAIGSIEWSGDVPHKLRSAHLEGYMFKYGIMGMFKHPKMGLVILPCTATSEVDYFNRPKYYLFSSFGDSKKVPADEVAIFRNNSISLPYTHILAHYTQLISEVSRTDRKNIRQLSFPWVFGADEDTVTSLKAAIALGVNTNDFAVFTTGINQLALEKGTGFQTGVKYLGDDLIKHAGDLYGECLTILGFDNIPITKAERLITAEASANDAQINFFREDRLSSRREGCERAEELFGITINVEWKGGEKNVQTMDGQSNDVHDKPSRDYDGRA